MCMKHQTYNLRIYRYADISFYTYSTFKISHSFTIHIRVYTQTHTKPTKLYNLFIRNNDVFSLIQHCNF